MKLRFLNFFTIAALGIILGRGPTAYGLHLSSCKTPGPIENPTLNDFIDSSDLVQNHYLATKKIRNRILAQDQANQKIQIFILQPNQSSEAEDSDTLISTATAREKNSIHLEGISTYEEISTRLEYLATSTFPSRIEYKKIPYNDGTFGMVHHLETIEITTNEGIFYISEIEGIASALLDFLNANEGKVTLILNLQTHRGTDNLIIFQENGFEHIPLSGITLVRKDDNGRPIAIEKNDLESYQKEHKDRLQESYPETVGGLSRFLNRMRSIF